MGFPTRKKRLFSSARWIAGQLKFFHAGAWIPMARKARKQQAMAWSNYSYSGLIENPIRVAPNIPDTRADTGQKAKRSKWPANIQLSPKKWLSFTYRLEQPWLSWFVAFFLPP